MGRGRTGGARDLYVAGGYAYLADDEGLFALAHSTLKVTPTAVTWLARVEGADPMPHMVRVESSGDPLAWTATISPSASWLEATPLSGATPAEIVLTAHVAGLSVGRHEVHLVVDAGVGVIGSPQAIPVTLIVAEQVFGSYLPLALRGSRSP